MAINVTIYVSGGTGIAEYTLEDGTAKEIPVGEVSDRWLDNRAEKYFAELLGEEVVLEVIDVEDSQDEMDWMSEAFTDGY